MPGFRPPEERTQYPPGNVAALGTAELKVTPGDRLTIYVNGPVTLGWSTGPGATAETFAVLTAPGHLWPIDVPPMVQILVFTSTVGAVVFRISQSW